MCTKRDKNRSGWDSRWYKKMNEGITKNKFTLNTLNDTITKFDPPKSFISDISIYPEKYVKPGYVNAIKTLTTFLESRSQNYNKHLSKPFESRKSCSRICHTSHGVTLALSKYINFLKIIKKQKVFQVS